MYRDPKDWVPYRIDEDDPLTPIEVEAEQLLERIAKEESKPIPSPELRELRKEYSKVKRYAEIAREGRILTKTENAFEVDKWARGQVIMRMRREWQDRMEQAVRERNRELFDWDFYRKHRWNLSWTGRRVMLGEFVRTQAVGFKRIARIKYGKILQELRMWSARLK